MIPVAILSALTKFAPALVKGAGAEAGLTKMLAGGGGNLGNVIGEKAHSFVNRRVQGLGEKMGQMEDPENLVKIPGRAIGGAVNAMKQDSPFAAGGEMLRALPLGPLGKFGATLLESVDGIRNFGNQLHDINTSFADVSVSMAQVKMHADANAIWLRMEQGERRAATAMEISEARARLNAAAAPFEDAWANFRNKIGSRLMDFLSKILETAEPLVEITSDVAEGLVRLYDMLPSSPAASTGTWMASMIAQQTTNNDRPANMR